jgi:hypothetical protein
MPSSDPSRVFDRRRKPVLALLVFICLACRSVRADEPGDVAVPTYHADAARSGLYVAPWLTVAQAAALHLDHSYDGSVDGQIIAQPLYWRPRGAAHGMVIVTTETDTVNAVDAVSGKALWRSKLGLPVSRSLLLCGNIDPVGITGTPVIDPAVGVLYADALVAVQGVPHHRVFALRLGDGTFVPGWPIDLEAGLEAQGIHFESRLENQRGALALVSGRLYVPFGGNFGDCGDYHGVVAGLDVMLPHVFGAWVTRARKAGIWTPGGVVSDGRSLFVATGNAAPGKGWGDQEAVIRLSPDLHHSADPRDFFAPSDWHQLDERHAELGGVNPLPIDVSGPEGVRALLLQLGKDGNAYLLDRANLGGLGGALSVDPVARSTIITAPAAWPATGYTIVVFAAPAADCPDGGTAGLSALLIAAVPHLVARPIWCAALDAIRPVPIITTTDGHANPIVWVAGGSGDDRLHAFRAETGEIVFTGGATGDRMIGLGHFATVLPAENTLYVAGDARVYAFRPSRH